MSTYERYDLTAAHYDATRRPVGAEIALGALSLARRPLDRVHLLDAGCGTGAYTAALAPHLGRITALDRSRGMLAVARGKLADARAAGRVAFARGAIEALPFAAQSFDAVLFNQVLHHLEDGGDPAYPGHREAIAEAARALRPSGVLIVNACSHEQLRAGFWYYALVPEALQAVLARCAPAERILEILSDCGLRLHDRIVPLDAVLQGAAYFDPRGPLDPAWRKGDSFWALATPERIAAAETRIRDLDASDRLAAFFAESDAARRRCGQVTLFVAVRA